MRITSQEKNDIIQLAHKHIDQNARIWLFGSRVDDHAKGGDIDLLIEVDGITNLIEKKIHFRLALEDLWGERKVDIVLHDSQTNEQAIHIIAKMEGVRLV